MQLFISYARVDKALADSLAADGHALGHHVFYDQDLSGGQRWWDTLLDQIMEAEVFLPVLSDDYRGSQACRAEAEWAAALGVPFVPIVSVEQSPGLYDPVIAEANWISYDPASRDSLAALARGLAAAPAVTPRVDTPARPAIPLTYLNAIDRQLRDPVEISRGDQLTLISDLRSKLGSRDDHNARELLAALRARPEITYEAAVTIDSLLAVEAEPAAPDPGSSPTAPEEEAPEPTAPDRHPDPPEPAAPAPPRSPRGPSGRFRVARLVATGAASLAALVAAALAPWVHDDYYATSYSLLESGSGVPRWLGVLALGGVATCVALAVWVQLARTRGLIRAGATAVILATAAVALIGAKIVAKGYDQSMAYGPKVLVAALVVLAVLTAVPSLNASRRPPS